MKCYYTITAMLIMLAAAGMNLNADEANKSMTYSEYVKVVTEKLPDLKKNRLQVDRAQNSLDGAYSSGDLNLFGSGSWSSSDNYSSSQYTGTGTQNVTDYSFSAGVSKKFTETGTTIETGVGHDTISTEGYGTTHYPSVYVKFSQSVLKNSFGVIDRYAVKNASMQLEIEKIRQAESDKTSLNYYRKLYFSWIEITERLELLNDSIRYATVIEADTAKKYRAGLTGVEDLYSAQALAAQYRIKYEELLYQRTAIEAEIKVFLGSRFSPAKEEFSIMYSEVSSAEYSEVPFNGTQNAEIFRLTKNNLVYSRDVSRNSLLPQLDIVGQYTRKSAEGEFGSYTGLEDSDYYLGFSVSYPLWNTEAESSVRESEIAIEEINAEYIISENAYRSNVEKLINEKESIKRKIVLSESRIKALEARYNTVYKKYRQGNQSLQQVIDALQDITNEKTVLYQYKSTMIQGYIDYTDLTR